MTQMTELVEKSIKSYFNCILYVQETRVQHAYVSSSNMDNKNKGPHWTSREGNGVMWGKIQWIADDTPRKKRLVNLKIKQQKLSRKKERQNTWPYAMSIIPKVCLTVKWGGCAEAQTKFTIQLKIHLTLESIIFLLIKVYDFTNLFHFIIFLLMVTHTDIRPVIALELKWN